MSQILQQYQLTFKNHITSSGEIWKLCTSSSATDSTGIALHLSRYQDTEAYEYLLDDVNRAINNQPYQGESNVGGSSVSISPTTVTIDDYVTIPTLDYKGILEEWIAFLKTPPFNFQKVE